MAERRVVSKPVTPAFAPSKASGRALYPTDVNLPGMLYLKILRSPHTHAKIKRIDTAKAEKLPGVEAVFTYENVPRAPFGAVDDMYILDDTVRFPGDEVAAVAAVNEDVAEDALRLIDVEYEPLPAVTDPEEALKPDAPRLYESGNVVSGAPDKPTVAANRGDLDTGFTDADMIIERVYTVPGQAAVCLEAHGCVAHWDGDKLTLWESTQKPFYFRREISKVLGIPLEKVRVIATVVGGGYGNKTFPLRYTFLASLASINTRRPVKAWHTREEETYGTWLRYPMKIYMKAGVKRDGTITALSCKAIANAGNAARESTFALVRGAREALMLFQRIPNARYEAYAVYTNTPAGGGWRGYGGPEIAFAVSVFMDEIAQELSMDRLERWRPDGRLPDEIAQELSMDPIQLVSRNCVRPGDDLAPLHPGAKMSTVGLEECMARGSQAIGWGRRSAGQTQGAVRRGIGMGIGMWSGGTYSSEAQVDIREDGSVLLRDAVVDIGTEEQTGLRQMAAEVLGMPYEAVDSISADTDQVPEDMHGIVSSRSTLMMGVAVVRAAEEAKKKLLDYGSERLEVKPEELECRDGRVYVKADPSRFVSFAEVAEASGGVLVGRASSDNIVSVYGFSACFADVKVDTETGEVRLVKIVNAVDAGRPINPVLLKGQVQGATAMGIGYALKEEVVVDPYTGTSLNQFFWDYRTPSIMDLPNVDVILVDQFEPLHPFGAKGAAEVPMVSTAPAIANAVSNALGVRMRQIPITPEKVVGALQDE